MSDSATVWPTCPAHTRGLHPKLIERTPTWQCTSGPHTVAHIGHLEVS